MSKETYKATNLAASWKANPKAEVLYQTSDGQCFTNENAANGHAGSLKDKKIEEHANPGDADASNEDEADPILGKTKGEWQKLTVKAVEEVVKDEEDLEGLKALSEAEWITKAGANAAIAARIAAIEAAEKK